MLAASEFLAAYIINLRDMSRLVTDRVQRFRLSAIVRHCQVFLFLESVRNHSRAETDPSPRHQALSHGNCIAEAADTCHFQQYASSCL